MKQTKEDRVKNVQNLIDEKAVLMAERDMLNERIKQLREKITQEYRNIESLNHHEIVVSDHAMLRYIERVMGLDIEQLKREIVTDNVRLGVTLSKTGKFNNGNGSMVIVTDNVVKTTWAA